MCVHVFTERCRDSLYMCLYIQTEEFTVEGAVCRWIIWLFWQLYCFLSTPPSSPQSQFQLVPWWHYEVSSLMCRLWGAEPVHEKTEATQRRNWEMLRAGNTRWSSRHESKEVEMPLLSDNWRTLQLLTYWLQVNGFVVFTHLCSLGWTLENNRLGFPSH